MTIISMSFLSDDDYILLMDTPPVFPNFPQIGDRSFKRDDFQRVADAGIKTTVNYVNWDLIEPQRGDHDWSYLDRAVEDALSAGMKVLISDYTFGPRCLPDELYSSPAGGPPNKYYGALSIWNQEAQEYVEEFVRTLGKRYVSERVNLFCTQAEYGETYLASIPGNVFYDPAALESFREYTGNPNAVPQGYQNNMSDPSTEEWLRQSILKAMYRRQKLIMEINGNNEIWHSAHHLWNWQGAGAGAKFIRDVLDSYVVNFPGVKINCIQYTYWVHGNNFNYAAMLDQDIEKYGMRVFVGAEYCEGLPVFTPQIVNTRLKGFILAPLSVLTNHTQLEDWMLENIRDAIEILEKR